MSSTYSFAPSALCQPGDGGPSGPLGFGVWNVPSASQRSCQRRSIASASAAVYRWGGTSAAGAAASPVAVRSDVVGTDVTGSEVTESLIGCIPRQWEAAGSA